MTTLRLLGYPVSNYVNICRAALIEKQIDFAFVPTRSSQEPGFLALSPMGKIPVLETPDGPLSETVAILEYLEDAYPAHSLRPTLPFERARARQVINIIQMYIEAQVRLLFPGVFLGGQNSPAVVAGVEAMLGRAVRALGRILAPVPFLFGQGPGQADLFAYYNLDIADRVTRFVYNRSIVEEIGGLGDWSARMQDLSSTYIVMGDFELAFASYLLDHEAAYRQADKSRAKTNA